MRVKLSTLSLLVACFLGINLSLWGQNVTAVSGIRGYVDPRTGIYHSIPQPQAADVESRAVTTFTGKFVFNFTITVNSTIASTSQIGCFASISTNDATNLNNVADAAGVSVARGSGSTVKCTVTIPYSWKLGNSSADMVHLSYSIGAPFTLGIATNTTAFPQREGAQSIGTIKVPLNGATTTETITATM